jgi:hypothetical protein
MPQKTIGDGALSRRISQELQALGWKHVQGLIQTLLEKEGTECLGRPQSARRAARDAPWEDRKGNRQPRRMAMTWGPITVRRPRLHGLRARPPFEWRMRAAVGLR